MMMDYNTHIKVVIWGMGNNSKKVYSELLQITNIVSVVGYADNNHLLLNQRIANGESINNILDEAIHHMVYSPCEVKDLYNQNMIDGVIIGTSNLYYDELKNQIENELKVPVIEIPNINWKWAEELSNNNIAYTRFNLNAYRLSDIIYKKTLSLNNVIAYTLDGKAVIDDLNGNRCKWMDEKILPPIGPEIYILEDEVCPLARLWAESNYSHFMLEVLPHILFLEDAGYKGKYILQKTSWSQNIIEYIPLSKGRIIWLEELPNITLLKKVVYSQGVNMNDTRAISQLIQWCTKIRNEFNCEPDKYPKRVFVKRIGTRKLNGVDHILDENGFFQMVPEEHSVIEQWKYFMNADIIISSHGAAMANCIFLKEGSSVIETFCKEWISNGFVEVYNRFNLKYHAIPEINLQFGGEIANLGQFTDSYCVDETMLRLAIRDSISY